MSRRELREHLIRLLYLREFHEADEMEEQARFYFDVILPNEGLDCTESEEVLEKYRKIAERLPEIDALLMAKMENWNMNRIGLTEKSIMRLCAFEIAYDEISEKIAINEAVELAKLYGGNQSAGFVNGVMARMVKAEK